MSEAVARLHAVIGADVDGLNRGLSDAQGKLGGFKNFVGNAMSTAGGFFVHDFAAKALGALKDVAGFALNTAMDYEKSMNMFQAVTGATEEQMAAAGQLAKELGADMTLPATSAGDAGEAMTELAKAGLSVENSMKAAKGALQLAAAGGLEEAQAAEIAANALNSFQLDGSKASKVADMFAAAANKSSVEVTDIADSFKMASAVFSAFQGGVVGSEEAMEDLTTAIAVLGNVGIKGSDAGTSLKQMLLQLTGPSQKSKDAMEALYLMTLNNSASEETLRDAINGTVKERGAALIQMREAAGVTANQGDIAYDASGKMRSMGEIVGLVTKATKDMSDEQRNAALTQIFGADATRAIIGLMKAGPEAFADMEAAIEQEGAASELAGARTKGLAGAFDGLKSQLETLALSAAEPLLKPLEDGIRSVAEVVGSPEVIAALSQFGADVGNFIGGAITFVTTEAPKWGAAINAAWQEVQRVAQPIVEAIGSVIQTVFGNIQQVVAEDGPTVLQNLTTAWETVKSIVEPVITSIGTIVSTVFGAVKSFLEEHGQEIQTFIGEAWTKVSGIVAGVVEVIKAIIVPVFEGIAKFISDNQEGIKQVIETVWTVIKTIISSGLTIVDGLIKAALAALKGDWSGAWEAIKTAFSSVWEGIKTALGPHLATIENAINTAWTAVKTTAETAWASVSKAVGDAFTSIGNWWTTNMQPVFTAIGLAFQSILDWAVANWPKVQQAIGDVFTAISGFWTNTLQPVFAAIGDAFEYAVTWVKAHWPEIQAAVESVFAAISNVWTTVLQPVLAAIVDAVEYAVTWVVAHWPEIQAAIESAFAAIQNVWDTVLKPTFEAIVDAVEYVIHWISVNFQKAKIAVENAFIQIQAAVARAIRDIQTTIAKIGATFADLKVAAENAWNSVKTAIETAINNAITFLQGVPAKMLEFGKNIIQGIADGINAAPGAVWEALKGAVLGGIDQVKKFLGIQSPSKLFFGFGKNMMLGLAEGINKFGDLPTARIGGVVSGMAVAGMSGASVVNNYNYNPTYSAVPNGPQQDFNIMKSLALA